MLKKLLAFTCVTLSIWTNSVSAGQIQEFEFFLGNDPTVSPERTVRIEFPQAAGCVSGIAFFNPPLDCLATFGVAPADEADPTEIIITSSDFDDGLFNVGAWLINEDSRLLERFFFSFSGDDGDAVFKVGLFGSAPYPEVEPVGTLGDWSLDGNSFDAVLVKPVPIPAAAWLFGSALLGLGVVKRKKA